MPTVNPILLIVAAAVTACVGLTLWRIWCLRRGIRAALLAHSRRGVQAIPGGGIVVALMAVALLAVQPGVAHIVMAGSVALLAFVAFVDDFRPLPAILRLVLQVLVTTTLCICVMPDVAWWMILFVSMWLVSYTNAFNFMDGCDGMLSLSGAVQCASAAWLCYSLPELDALWWQLSAVMAAALLVFGVFNMLMSPRMIAGDVGSMPVGLLVALTLAIAAMAGAGWTVVVLVSVYLVDTGMTLLWRAWRGQPLLHSHRDHLYQRFRGNRRVAAAYAALQTIINVLWFAIPAVWRAPYVLLVFAVMIAAWATLSRTHRPH